MGIFDNGLGEDAKKAYDVAETKVDGFFARNKYTALMVAGALVVLLVFAVL